MGEIRCYVVRQNKLLERLPSMDAALAISEKKAYLWIDLTDPTEADFAPLVEPFELHPLAIEDCLDDDQVPKMEEFPGHSFVLFNRWRQTGGPPAVEEVNFFLNDRYLLTVHAHGLSPDALADRFEACAKRDLAEARHGPDHLLHVLLDEIVDEKFEAIEALQEQLDDIEERILDGSEGFQPGQLVHLRRSLLRLRKSLVYEREILTKLCRRDSPYVSEAAVYAFRDINDHLTKFFEVVEICRELVASIIEIHLSAVNNQMALIGNRTNFVMRRLTMITVIFMPMTLLSGIGGMSEWSAMTKALPMPVAYALFFVLMGVVGWASYRVLIWLDRRDRRSAS
ncbi:MAG: magnesium transporter CorA family protein [Armatimonadetes bacterium]|nr:magnesium transporter CorA family protein [Armatimonadota bacterium]